MPAIWLAKIGFSTAATTLRPPVGETWVMKGLIEIGTAPTLVLTDGTTSENFRTSDQFALTAAITNEWYLSLVATTAILGWLVTFEMGITPQSGLTPGDPV